MAAVCTEPRLPWCCPLSGWRAGSPAFGLLGHTPAAVGQGPAERREALEGASMGGGRRPAGMRVFERHSWALVAASVVKMKKVQMVQGLQGRCRSGKGRAEKRQPGDHRRCGGRMSRELTTRVGEKSEVLSRVAGR